MRTLLTAGRTFCSLDTSPTSLLLTLIMFSVIIKHPLIVLILYLP